MKRIGLIATAAVLVILVAGVIAVARHDGGSDDGPAARTESFERALIKGDCPAMKKLVVSPDQVDCAELGEMSASVQNVDPDKITYTLIDSGKDTATVQLKILGEKQKLDLVRESGIWLVIFDTAA